MPSSAPLSSLDTIASAYSLSSAYGRVVAYTAIFEGANFATLSSSKIVEANNGMSFRCSDYMYSYCIAPSKDLTDMKSVDDYPIPSATIFFVTPSHLMALTKSVLDNAKKSSFLLYSLAWRHKLSGILEGFFTKQSLWDRLVFDGARMQVMGKGAGTVRGIIVSGGVFIYNVDYTSLIVLVEPIESQVLTPARVALSVPLVFVHSHPQVSGPVLATHPLDVQAFPAETASPGASAADNYAFSYLSAIGAPAINVETKLAGVDDAAVEDGQDPVGNLMIRGPSVGVLLDVEPKEGELDKGWIESGERAKVMPNGTFKVVSAGK